MARFPDYLFQFTPDAHTLRTSRAFSFRLRLNLDWEMLRFLQLQQNWKQNRER
jgi:hypothetical protein